MRLLVIWTPLDFAVELASEAVFTLKPTMRHPNGTARSTSDDVMGPTPVCTTLIFTASFPIATRDSLSASADPCTSALMMTGMTVVVGSSSDSSATSGGSDGSVDWPRRRSDLGALFVVSMVVSVVAKWSSLRILSCSARSTRALLSFCARSSLATATSSSPALGTPLRPTTSTGRPGSIPTVLTLPVKSFSVRTFPHSLPTTIESPRLSSPAVTITMATGPCPLSTLASTTTPFAGTSTAACGSSNSDSINSACSSSFSPTPLGAASSTTCTVPPYSSISSPRSATSCFTRSTFAPSKSHFVMATTIGHPDAFACAYASLVWGMTPSSAATTRITISVMAAPRARIAENAA